jgi:pyroglutamyl-peptidase
MTSAAPVKVLVTGFGPFLDITTNSSWEIARRLPASILGLDGESIHLIVPDDPMPAAYHDIKTQVASLIDTHAPDLVVHMGLDVDSGPGVFKIERSAPREGYHEFPDIRRKVYTRIENKKDFAKAPASLTTSLDTGCCGRDLASRLRPNHPCNIESFATKRQEGDSAGETERACPMQ